MLQTSRGALLVAIVVTTLHLGRGLDLGLDNLGLEDQLANPSPTGDTSGATDALLEAKPTPGLASKSSYLNAISGFIVFIEDSAGTLIYTGPKNFCILNFNVATMQNYSIISLNGPTIFAVESDETSFVELTLEEFGIDNLKSLVKLKETILKRLKTLALGRPILEYDDLTSSSYANSGSSYGGIGNSYGTGSYGARGSSYGSGGNSYGSNGNSYGSNGNSYGISRGGSGGLGSSSSSYSSSASISVYHQKDDDITNDIYILDYIGNLNAIYSGTVGTYLRDGYSIIYRNQLTWTYRRSDFPGSINRIVRLGDNVISVFDDYSVLGKTVKILDPTEFGVYMRANSEISSLILEDDKTTNSTTNLLQGSAQSQTSNLGQDVLETADSIARSVNTNKLDRYSFSLANSTGDSRDSDN